MKAILRRPSKAAELSSGKTLPRAMRSAPADAVAMSNEYGDDGDDDDDDDDESDFDFDGGGGGGGQPTAMSLDLMRVLGMDTSAMAVTTDWKPPDRYGLGNSKRESFHYSCCAMQLMSVSTPLPPVHHAYLIICCIWL